MTLKKRQKKQGETCLTREKNNRGLLVFNRSIMLS